MDDDELYGLLTREGKVDVSLLKRLRDDARFLIEQPEIARKGALGRDLNALLDALEHHDDFPLVHSCPFCNHDHEWVQDA